MIRSEWGFEPVIHKKSYAEQSRMWKAGILLFAVAIIIIAAGMSWYGSGRSQFSLAQQCRCNTI